MARWLLDAANIEPAVVKAILKPAPQVHGGPRARRFPWPRRRHFDGREKRAVMRLMDREIRKGGAVIYGGPETRAYCEGFAEFLGGGYAAAVNSGTNAVYVALRALDLQPGTEVIVPPITDAGGTMPVVLLNCIPVPADSEPGSLNTSADQIRKVLTDRTSAIVVAHVSGHAVDLGPILALAAERNIPVVEDCAQAHGALYKGRPVGTFGAIAAFSTMFGKHHATGAQGGVVFTRDTLLFARTRQAIDRGKPAGAVGNPGNVVASLNFNQDEISMTIGRVQLAKLPAALEARRRFAALVGEGLAGLAGVSLVGDDPDRAGAYWFLCLQLDSARLSCDGRQFATALELEGIGGVHAGYPFFPTDQAWHRDAIVFGASGMPWSLRQEKPGRYALPNAHAANQAMVRVDVHETLGPGEARDLVRAVRKIAAHYAASATSVPAKRKVA
ncbi:MAG: DegT/DnrJ/EryC1/StrS family aminotransferase [Phenylobacterium sp.]